MGGMIASRTDPLSQPLSSAEFLAVDVETNGLPRDRCELTEVGTVLVGGGELHERWSSLVTVQSPLSRGIQRFTGVTQAMVDGAPPPETVLPELAEQLTGRILVAHSARFDTGVLRQAFVRAELVWPDPLVLCTVAVARRLAPLQQRRGLATLAAALGIEVDAVHRALPDAETCARVFCALFPKLCAHAGTVGEAIALLGPRRGTTRAQSGGAAPRRRRPEDRPDLAALPQDPGIYLFRDADGHVLYIGKSVRLRDRARAHFTSDAEWTERAAHVDHRPTESELGALLTECRLVRELRPPGNTLLKREPDGLVFIRCRLDIAFPILEVARDPAPGHGVTIGPVRGRALAAELVEQLNSLFGLRHCGRTVGRRAHPSAYGEMGRCLSPCLGDLDPNLYRARLDSALALFRGHRPGAALLGHVSAQMRAAAAEQRYEQAAWLRRRRDRLEAILARLGGVLRVTHAGARLVYAPHPSEPGRGDALWIAGGRVVDWGPMPASTEEIVMRSRAALRASGSVDAGGWLPAAEIDEVRIVGSWIAAHAPPTLELHTGCSTREIGDFLAAAGFDPGAAQPQRIPPPEPVRPAGPARPRRTRAAARPQETEALALWP